MGRRKLAMEFIKNEKSRNATYAKRKKGLLKKSSEFSILCNVPICIIMFPYKKEGKQPLDEAEVYSFKGGDGEAELNHVESSRARDPKIAKEIIGRYLKVSKDNKRTVNLCDMFDEWTRKANKELCKLRHNNALSSGECANFDGVDLNQLMEVLDHLDQKIEYAKQRISMVTTKRGNYNNNNVIVPYFEPTPISNLMIPEFEIVNQFPLFNYPIINHNNQEFCHQLVPFNHQQDAFIDRIGTSRSMMMMDDHLHDHYGGNNYNNLFIYNVNMMYGVPNAMYYDQGLRIADDVEATSSNGGGLPMNMPVMQNNVSLPWKSQYHQQRFYK